MASDDSHKQDFWDVAEQVIESARQSGAVFSDRDVAEAIVQFGMRRASRKELEQFILPLVEREVARLRQPGVGFRVREGEPHTTEASGRAQRAVG